MQKGAKWNAKKNDAKVSAYQNSNVGLKQVAAHQRDR